MKKLEWIGSSKRDLLKFPDDVIQEVGYALHLAQLGNKYSKTKPFKGHGSRVYEVVTEYEKNAYRCVYFVDTKEYIFVLHSFQKKSKLGIKTPREEIEVIKQRMQFLKTVREI